jgi:GNAT superfamily N-acetyltransferase
MGLPRGRARTPALRLCVDGVRVAHGGDRAVVTANVAAAFAHDPAWAFLLGADYDRLAPVFAGALFDTRVGAGSIWVSADLAAVAMWEKFGANDAHAAVARQVWKEYRAAVGSPTWDRLAEYERALDEVRPASGYWYLGVLATRPDRQGEGLATAVMAPVLDRADRDGVDCCLETSTTANRSFYQRRGFTDVTTVHIESGPPTWWLRRAPSDREPAPRAIEEGA